MGEHFYDVIIVGGGPAGSSCGMFLKKLAPELRVCIIDKQQFPRNKPCGDGLSPAVIDLMAEVGLQHLFSEKHPISVFELSLGEAFRIRYDMRNLSHTRSFGFVYDRMSFDDHLLQHAVACGVHLFEKHEISKIEEVGLGYTQLMCEHADNTTHFTGRIVVGADGAYSKVRSYLNIPPNDGMHKGVSLRYYCTTTKFEELSLRIDFLKNLGYSYGWLFPLSPTVANVGVGIDSDVYKKKNINLNNELNAYVKLLQKSIPLQIIPGTRAGYPLPYGTYLPKLVHGNKVLIGDAASMINPLTGEGIYYAMYAGKLLASYLAEGFRSGSPGSTVLQHFERDFKNHFQQHYQLNLKFKKLLTSPFAPLFLRMLQKDPALLNRVMHIVMGNANTLDVKHLWLKMLKRSSWFVLQQFKNPISKQSAGV